MKRDFLDVGSGMDTVETAIKGDKILAGGITR